MKYVIVDFINTTQQMIDDCIQNSFNTLKHTITGTDKIILKYKGSQPPSLSGYTEYTHSEILIETAKIEWTDNS